LEGIIKALAEAQAQQAMRHLEAGRHTPTSTCRMGQADGHEWMPRRKN
jgi:hypothetical protein